MNFKPSFPISLEDESDEVEMPVVVQEEEKPKSETGKAIERERDAAIKRKTLALEERMNDFKEMLRERAVRKKICSFVFLLIFFNMCPARNLIHLSSRFRLFQLGKKNCQSLFSTLVICC